jgi:hypothetical protein
MVVAVDGLARREIQAPKPEPRIMRYELTDYESGGDQVDAAEQAARRAAWK